MIFFFSWYHITMPKIPEIKLPEKIVEAKAKAKKSKKDSVVDTVDDSKKEAPKKMTYQAFMKQEMPELSKKWKEMKASSL